MARAGVGGGGCHKVSELVLLGVHTQGGRGLHVFQGWAHAVNGVQVHVHVPSGIREEVGMTTGGAGAWAQKGGGGWQLNLC